MPDNVTLNSGSGGATLATDDIAGVQHQRVKIQYGADGAATDVSDSNPLPIDDAGGSITVDDGGTSLTVDGTVGVSGTVTVDGSASTQPVSGTVTANLGATDNAVLDSIETNTTNIPNVIGTDGAAGPTRALSVAGTESGGNLQELRVDGDGHLQVDIVSGGASGGTSSVDDSAFSVGSGSGTPMMGLADETATDSVDEGDVGVVRMSLDRRLLVDAQIAGQDSTVTVDGSAVTQPVSGTVTANLSATDNAVLDTIETNTDFGTVTGGGAESGALRVTLANDSTGVVSVDDGGGSLTVDGSVSADATGNVAHDAADSGNPVKIGAKATNSVEGLTQVAADDRTDLRADLNGVLITRPHTTLEEIISERVADTGGTSTAFSNFAAGGAGVHNYVTTISIYNSSATDGYVDFRDGTGGSVLFTAAAPATGGSIINLPVPLKGAANTALAYDVSGALSTVYISVVGFQAQG